jgi:hypothetical protein
MTTTIFLPDSEMYPHRYVAPDNTDIEFLRLDALDEFVGEYYYFINQGIDPTIDNLFKMEYISSMEGNVQPRDSVDIKNHIKNVFPERILKDVQSGKCKYIIDQSLEGHWKINWEYIFDTLSITKEQLVWISGDYKIHEKTNNIAMYVNWWERNCCEQIHDVWDITQSQLKLIESRTERAKYNTVYSRRIRHHRVALMTTLVFRDLLDDMIWSWGGDVTDPPDRPAANITLPIEKGGHMHAISKAITKTHPPHVLFSIGSKFSEAYDVVAQWGTVVSEMSDTKTNLNKNHANIVTPSHVLNTYYQCIVETYATSGETTFLSEKSFKPFMLMQPFVMYGDPLTVQALREHGYDVYDEWIDHAYDLIMDPAERLERLVGEIRRLNAISHTEWSNRLYEMKDTLIANHKHLSTANLRYNIKLRGE